MIRWFVMVTVLAFVMVAQSKAADDYVDFYDEVPVTVMDDGGLVIGYADAPVTVIEFVDFLCPHCQNYEDTLMQFIETYVVTGRAKFEMRYFPVVDAVLSPLSAAVAECAAEQNAFWRAHGLLYKLARQDEIGADLAAVVAAELELDTVLMAGCVAEADQSEIDFAFGQAIGILGTPGMRVRIGESDPYILTIDTQEYTSGGIPLEALAVFIESDNPRDYIRQSSTGPQA